MNTLLYINITIILPSKDILGKDTRRHGHRMTLHTETQARKKLPFQTHNKKSFAKMAGISLYIIVALSLLSSDSIFTFYMVALLLFTFIH